MFRFLSAEKRNEEVQMKLSLKQRVIVTKRNEENRKTERERERERKQSQTTQDESEGKNTQQNIDVRRNQTSSRQIKAT